MLDEVPRTSYKTGRLPGRPAALSSELMRRRLSPVLALIALLLAGCPRGGETTAGPRPDGPVERPDPAAEREAAIQQLADRYMARAAANEPEVSRILQELAAQQGGTMAGFEHRLKKRDSLLRKIRSRLADSPDTPVSEIVIDDALRYTLQVDDQPAGRHGEAIRATFAALEAAGHKVDRVKNYWPRGDNYSGVNTVLLAPDGLPWELQFHTADSFRVKQETHELYEEMREDATPAERKRELFRQLAAPWEHVAIPEGLLTPNSLHPSEDIIRHDPP